MDYAVWPNLATLFFRQVDQQGDRPFLWVRRQGFWHALTRSEAARQVSQLSRGLRSLGVNRGDRVALVSENRPEWLVADLAILAAGAITVPAYITNTVEDHRHILANSGARGVIVSTPALLDPVREAARPLAAVEFILAMDAEAGGARPERARTEAAPPLHEWKEVLEAGAARPDDVREVAGNLRREDLACILHTSGTGGRPKGAVLTHGAILSNLQGSYLRFCELGLGERDVFLSFLPLSHAYEHTVGQFLALSVGAQIYYAGSAQAVQAYLKEARPTLMIAVPRLLDTMHQRIVQGIRRSGPVRRWLFQAALDLDRRRVEGPEDRTLPTRAAGALIDLLVRRRVRAGFGGRLKALVSGGGPLNPEVGLFFSALGVRVLQGYGLTEAAPVVSCNPPSRIKSHTVGTPLQGTEVRLAEDGEILVRGGSVMEGYWNDPDATAAALQDGWLHTGDIGTFDEDGYLTITDRKKDIIKNSGGDMISPQRVELRLVMEPEIAQALVLGDGRPHLVAILVPEIRLVEEWARERGTAPDMALCSQDPGFQRLFTAAVERTNAQLPTPERIRRFLLGREAFTQNNGLLTPTLKLRRHRILAAYEREIEALYAGPQSPPPAPLPLAPRSR